jgi:hypothetical protein
MSFKNIRNIGRPWQFKFAMRDLLNDDTSSENARRVAEALAARIKSFLKQTNLLEPAAAKQGRLLAERLDRAAKNTDYDVDYFNHDLDVFWDWADDARILVE